MADPDQRVFRVTGTSGKIMGPFLLHIHYPNILLLETDTRQHVATFHIPYLRGYGQQKGVFMFDAGRRCPTGPGRYAFAVMEAGVNIFDVLDRDIAIGRSGASAAPAVGVAGSASSRPSTSASASAPSSVSSASFSSRDPAPAPVAAAVPAPQHQQQQQSHGDPPDKPRAVGSGAQGQERYMVVKGSSSVSVVVPPDTSSPAPAPAAAVAARPAPEYTNVTIGPPAKEGLNYARLDLETIAQANAEAGGKPTLSRQESGASTRSSYSTIDFEKTSAMSWDALHRPEETLATLEHNAGLDTQGKKKSKSKAKPTRVIGRHAQRRTSTDSATSGGGGGDNDPGSPISPAPDGARSRQGSGAGQASGAAPPEADPLDPSFRKLYVSVKMEDEQHAAQQQPDANSYVNLAAGSAGDTASMSSAGGHSYVNLQLDNGGAPQLGNPDANPATRPPAALPRDTSSGHSRAIALYTNKADAECELSFRKGEILTVLKETYLNNNQWWFCSLNGRQGAVPTNYVKKIL